MTGNQSLEEFGKKLVSFRFVVLHHQLPADSGRSSHWDLLLQQTPEFGSGLLTFEVSVPPKEWGDTTFVRKLPDHRTLYLRYEGHLSDNRGIVTRILSGTIQWQVLTAELLILAVQSDTFPYAGSPIQGELRVSKFSDQTNPDRWKLEYAREFG